MTEFFVPRTGEIKLSTGVKHVVLVGIRDDLPDDVVNDSAANAYGIKPVHEMTPFERTSFGLPDALPDVVAPKPVPVVTPAPATPTAPPLPPAASVTTDKVAATAPVASTPAVTTAKT